VQFSGLLLKLTSNCALPISVGKSSNSDFKSGTWYRPGPEPRANGFHQILRSDRKAKPNAGKPEELAERTQYNCSQRLCFRSEAGSRGANIHERFIDHQQAASS